jgi:hypothetical protein
MTTTPPTEPTPIIVTLDSVEVMMSEAPFVFPAGHRNRGARCIECGEPIGPRAAVTVVAAAVGAPVCSCGRVHADAYMIHADHVPYQLTALEEAFSRALQRSPCD